MSYTYSAFGGFRVPDEDASDDVPADLSYLIAQLDPVVRLEAASTAERDSKFYNAPAGAFCTVRNSPSHPTAPNALVGAYIKTAHVGAIGWATIYTPTTTGGDVPLQLTDGLEQQGTDTNPRVWRENSMFCNVEGAIVKTDASEIASGTVVAYLPTDMMPYRASQFFPVATSLNTSTTRVGSTKVSINGTTGAITYFGPALLWVSFDGIRYRTV